MTSSTDAVDDQLLTWVKSAFNDAGWAFREADRPGVIECNFEAHHTRVALHVQTFPELGVISVVGSPAIESAKDRLPKTVELLTRTNLSLTIGNLELDMDSGKIYYRATNIFPTSDTSRKADIASVTQSLVHAAIAEADRITPQVALINRDPSPAAVLMDIPELMAREDLLPPVPEQETDESK